MMKTNNRIWFCPVIIMGLVLILTDRCKKDDNGTVIIIDIDSNVYTSVAIGTQVWMTENLKTTRYSNGELIGTTTPATLDITAEATPKYQWAYNGDESNVPAYGRLYTWYAITDTRNVCPAGWHVPTDEEWTILTTLAGGDSVSGEKLKEAGTSHWSAPNTGVTNETYFTALPGGYHFYYGRFSDIGFSGFWWSSTEFSDSIAYGREMLSYNSEVNRFMLYKRNGFSVRCLRD